MSIFWGFLLLVTRPWAVIGHVQEGISNASMNNAPLNTSINTLLPPVSYGGWTYAGFFASDSAFPYEDTSEDLLERAELLLGGKNSSELIQLGSFFRTDTGSQLEITVSFSWLRQNQIPLTYGLAKNAISNLFYALSNEWSHSINHPITLVITCETTRVISVEIKIDQRESVTIQAGNRVRIEGLLSTQKPIPFNAARECISEVITDVNEIIASRGLGVIPKGSHAYREVEAVGLQYDFDVQSDIHWYEFRDALYYVLNHFNWTEKYYVAYLEVELPNENCGWIEIRDRRFDATGPDNGLSIRANATAKPNLDDSYPSSLNNTVKDHGNITFQEEQRISGTGPRLPIANVETS